MVQGASQTNALLFYAQRLMSIYGQESNTVTELNRHALLTGGWLCLKESWVCWLNELAQYVNLERAGGYQLNDLPLLLKADNPEGQIILSLMEDTESWLAQMLLRIEMPAERLQSSMPSQHSSQTLISIVSVDELSEDQLLIQVLTEFKAYIESVRVRQVEW